MKCIVVCSGKGGTGKSCVAAYTGAALAAAGARTLLVELGGGESSLAVILGVKDAAFGAGDVFAGYCEPQEATVSVEGQENLFLMPSGDGQPTEDEEALRGLLEPLRTQYDYLIVDGPGIDTFPTGLCDIFLLVVTPDTLSVRAGANTARQLYARHAKEVRLVINNVPARIIPIDGAHDFDDVIDNIGARLIEVIPASPKLAYCSNNAQPLDPESLTVKVFENLAGRLRGQRRPLLIR